MRGAFIANHAHCARKGKGEPNTQGSKLAVRGSGGRGGQSMSGSGGRGGCRGDVRRRRQPRPGASQGSSWGRGSLKEGCVERVGMNKPWLTFKSSLGREGRVSVCHRFSRGHRQVVLEVQTQTWSPTVPQAAARARQEPLSRKSLYQEKRKSQLAKRKLGRTDLAWAVLLLRHSTTPPTAAAPQPAPVGACVDRGPGPATFFCRPNR